MRILLCVQNYYPALGFGGRVNLAKGLAEGLVSAGHQVSVLTSSVIDPDIRPRLRGNSCSINGVRVHYLGTWLQYRATSINPGVVPFCLSRLRRFDAIHILGLYDTVGAVVSIFASLWRIPFVLEPIGMLVPVYRGFRRKAIYHMLVGNRMAIGAGSVVVGSETELRDCIAHGIPSTRLLLRATGVDLSTFSDLPNRGSMRAELGIAPDEQLFLYLGRLCAIKQVELLIKAFGQLGCSNFWLLIAGPHERDGYKQYLEDLASSQVGTSSRILFSGPLYGKAKQQAFVDADLFVLPSGEREAWGTVAAEAIVCGTPVIITEGCGLASYVRDLAGLVVPSDVPSIREAIRRLMLNRSLYETFRSNTANVAKGLSWDKPVQQMEKIYRGMVDP